ncbi:MAG: hypothetical protein IK139_09160 [Lachnospiraceae bacterium]|nr:hypothetical protein [Lachnospiraceae bacterium]
MVRNDNNYAEAFEDALSGDQAGIWYSYSYSVTTRKDNNMKHKKEIKANLEQKLAQERTDLS